MVPKAIVCKIENYFYDYNVYANNPVYFYLKERELRIGSSLVKERKMEKNTLQERFKEEYGFDKKAFLQKFTKEHQKYMTTLKFKQKIRLNQSM